MKYPIRFGMAHPTRVLGLVLVHPTSTTAGVMEQIKVMFKLTTDSKWIFLQDKIIDWKLGTVGHNPTTTQYLIFHKFGRDLMQVNKQKKTLKKPPPLNAKLWLPFCVIDSQVKEQISKRLCSSFKANIFRLATSGKRWRSSKKSCTKKSTQGEIFTNYTKQSNLG